MSHALRHEPWRYELELDEHGWVPLDQLLDALREQGGEWAQVGRADVEAMLASAAKQRHELSGDRIRARYGHSTPNAVVLEAGEPPARLFHGTSHAAWLRIQAEGLRPMRRQYVHLSTDAEMATEVGRRRDPEPLLLTVDAAAAVAAGHTFHRGNDRVWLTASLPASFLTLG
ncbi:RNA 2'-phosphotransferase [Propioniciclava coleopterorum]|uniref:Probable RNA 2'-phosphotransferase n=2 Tax=Propioniciclava coleopterorum TaxID=2714937 RepID=A0A6G7YBF6_9ACTN|nr:RNA 2'-phosphotransferase [Propioniciclava coleopterorum]